jgi:Na+-driven multidrug efflux pump
MDVMTGALRGFGCSTITAVTSFIGVCGFRMLWVGLVLPLNRAPPVLYACWPLSWALVIVMHVVTFFIIRPKAIKQMREQQ